MKKEDKKQLFRTVFYSDLGHVVFKEILEHCQMDKNPFDPENERRTTFNLGRQEIGRWLREMTKSETSDDD